ncbi:MAG: hypothetical protein HWE39_12705 [Oceanospirillaceae bacterium]|nr:hypothetical protein [Oceanospirillaceae bacterium]
MDRRAVCHGWQVTDLAHENINSAMSLLEVAIVAADDGGAAPKDLSGSLRIIRNLLKGSLPAINEEFPKHQQALVLLPASALLKAS